MRKYVYLLWAHFPPFHMGKIKIEFASAVCLCSCDRSGHAWQEAQGASHKCLGIRAILGFYWALYIGITENNYYRYQSVRG